MSGTTRHAASWTGITRRKALQATSAGSLLAALGGRGFHHVSAQGEPNPIVIPDTGAALPTGDVTFRVMSQGPGPRTPFYEAFFAAYGEAHPNISFQFEELPNDQIAQILTIALQDGEAPDLFFPAGAASNIGQAVAAGWLAALDDIIPDFETWKSRFPAGVFLDGITVFDGKTYTFPLGSSKRYGTLLFYNPEYLEQAGLDPSASPFSWQQFREAARTLTEQGGGQYFGLAMGAEPAVLADIINNFATSAGAAGGATLGGHIDWGTGEYTFTNDEYLAAIDLLLGLQADGSILPGALSLTQREAETNVTRGTAAMTLDGPWVIARWQEQSPDFSYGLAGQPTPDSGTFAPIGYPPGGANYHVVSSGSELQSVAGDILAIWGSPEGQAAFQSIVGGSLLAIFPEAQANADLDAQSQNSIAVFDEQMRLHPDPRVRRAGVGQVYVEHQGLQPNFGQVLQGLLSGQISDPQVAMQDLKDRADAELDRSIEAARNNGAEVSRDDWVFPNWDPGQDYTDADYEALDG